LGGRCEILEESVGFIRPPSTQFAPRNKKSSMQEEILEDFVGEYLIIL